MQTCRHCLESILDTMHDSKSYGAINKNRSCKEQYKCHSTSWFSNSKVFGRIVVLEVLGWWWQVTAQNKSFILNWTANYITETTICNGYHLTSLLKSKQWGRKTLLLFYTSVLMAWHRNTGNLIIGKHLHLLFTEKKLFYRSSYH